LPVFKRESISWGILVVEMVAIMLSVVLGFMLNEWRQERAVRAAAERAGIIIVREMETNLQVTEARRDRFVVFRDNLAALAEEDGAEAVLEPAHVGVTNLPPYIFLDGAYEAARASGALSAMDFRTIEAVTRAYSIQQIARDASWLLNEWFHEGRFRTIGDLQMVLAELLDPSLPASQEMALRVLRGEDPDEAERAANEKWWTN
jgi:hypothetical protein